MENPTIVVITDRNDLDGQLFGVFSLAQDLLREQPVQVSTRQKMAPNCHKPHLVDQLQLHWERQP